MKKLFCISQKSIENNIKLMPWISKAVNAREFVFPENFTTYDRFVTTLTRRVPLVEQELFILLEHMRSPPVFSGVRVTRSLVLCVWFVDRCLSLCPLSFGHCVVCPSIYRFWLPIWYIQTLHNLMFTSYEGNNCFIKSKLL
jgi:hypothetical protein